MNAVDEIQQAIDKLTALSAKAEPGRWDHQPYGGQNQNGDYAGGNIFDGDGEYLVSDVSDAAGALIVTLHRTIDAQLAILREAVEYEDGFGFADDDTALNLARAINGTST